MSAPVETEPQAASPQCPAHRSGDLFPLPGSSYRGPAPRYQELREQEPVVRVRTEGGVDAWLVTRYKDVRELSADPRLSRARACGPGAPRVGGTMHTTPEMIISLDSPEHSRLRKLVAGAFTLRRVERMRQGVQQVADQLLDDMQGRQGPVDLVQQLAVPLPLTVIGELLGVPAQDLRDFEKWARAFATVDDRAGGEESLQGLAKLSEYIVGLVADKRAAPADDMLSELIAARDNDDRLSEEELVTFGFTLIGAGFDTTANQLANSVLALLADHPGQWRWLAEDHSRIPRAVDELLRHVNLFATDTTGFPRIAAEDIEVGGVTIPKGDAVLLSLASANRDPAVFADPDRLDLDRARNPHISFGHGVHHCLGKHLGRMELEIALEGLLRRFPDLRLAVPESELPWHTGEINHTLTSLPVTWGEQA
ncbi:cytochrome P450 [Streptomyces candidus]|uniref:Nocardicin N-oxygenase n=1 Tax=Streptomyces candidus TaxID=67283 RepID=A0A7X0HHZ0_9ACTN|nr:cytochrome P450 [Streptomyces candidus]MBB6436687.1 nocardicin N-oxygenase [Streptomyces candidus]GHH51068.1 cytochrome P450 [Streptomyces candidus]